VHEELMQLIATYVAVMAQGMGVKRRWVNCLGCGSHWGGSFRIGRGWKYSVKIVGL